MQPPRADPFASYDPAAYYCELTARDGDSGSSALIRGRIAAIGLDNLRTRARAAELSWPNRAARLEAFVRDMWGVGGLGVRC